MPSKVPLGVTSAVGRQRFDAGKIIRIQKDFLKVLTDNFLEGPADGMTDGRQKEKGIPLCLDWNSR